MPDAYNSILIHSIVTGLLFLVLSPYIYIIIMQPVQSNIYLSLTACRTVAVGAGSLHRVTIPNQ